MGRKRNTGQLGGAEAASWVDAEGVLTTPMSLVQSLAIKGLRRRHVTPSANTAQAVPATEPARVRERRDGDVPARRVA